jgi:uncharacterized RDD family membrane protein YckC
MGARVVALLIDGVVVFFGLGELVALVAGDEHHSNGSFGFSLHGGAAALWLVLGFCYWIVLEYAWGTTLGKRLFSLRVVGGDGGRASFAQCVVRNVFRIVDGFPYLLPYLVGFVVALSDPDRRRVGDRVAGTRVVSGGDARGPAAGLDEGSPAAGMGGRRAG